MPSSPWSAAGIVAWRIVGDTVAPLLRADSCTATVQGRTVELAPEQAENAALISAVAVRRGMPARAATIALATAYQESKLTNIDYGDRDSLGLFQQRPSQGWGTRRQLLDPEYSINAFYDALARVDGYESMEITVAAQEVQRSAFPEAYADHEADARVLASALTGQSWRAFHCTSPTARATPPGPRRRRADRARGRRPATTSRRLRHRRPSAASRPDGVRDGHMRGIRPLRGPRDRRLRPAGHRGRTATAAGRWRTTGGQAARLDVRTVIFDGRIWTRGGGRTPAGAATPRHIRPRRRDGRDPRAPRPRPRRRLRVTRSDQCRALVRPDLTIPQPAGHTATYDGASGPVFVGCRPEGPLHAVDVYTIGTALGRARDHGVEVRVLVAGHWIEGGERGGRPRRDPDRAGPSHHVVRVDVRRSR